MLCTFHQLTLCSVVVWAEKFLSRNRARQSQGSFFLHFGFLSTSNSLPRASALAGVRWVRLFMWFRRVQSVNLFHARTYFRLEAALRVRQSLRLLSKEPYRLSNLCKESGSRAP